MTEHSPLQYYAGTVALFLLLLWVVISCTVSFFKYIRLKVVNSNLRHRMRGRHGTPLEGWKGRDKVPPAPFVARVHPHRKG